MSNRLRDGWRAAVAGLLFLAASPTVATDAGGATWRTRIRTFAQEHFRHPAWGYSHSVRDYMLASSLAAADHVQLDDDVLFAAALLHDLAAFPPWAKADKDHADEAAARVETVLRDTGFPMAKLEKVQGAIRTHMFDREPSGPEALYLHDADALDWLGAVGIARIIALVDPNGGKPDGPDVVLMLESNLAKVPSRVLSPAGRAQVSTRAASLQTFLAELKSESDNYHAL